MRKWWQLLGVVMGLSFLVLAGMRDGLALGALVMCVVAFYKAGATS